MKKKEEKIRTEEILKREKEFRGRKKGSLEQKQKNKIRKKM